jgi:hypothetical protein
MAIDSMEHEGTAADMNRIPKAGWRLIVPGQINTSSMPRKVLLYTLDAIEEFKRAAAVESIQEGLAVAKARCQAWPSGGKLTLTVRMCPS